MDQEDRLAQMDRAAGATAVAGLAREYVAEQREKVVQHLIHAYRGRDLTHDAIVGMIGELSALDAFMSELHYAQLRGQQSLQQEVTGGYQTEED